MARVAEDSCLFGGTGTKRCGLHDTGPCSVGEVCTTFVERQPEHAWWAWVSNDLPVGLSAEGTSDKGTCTGIHHSKMECVT